MLTFGIDWDDVISPLNDCAIELANQEYQFDKPYSDKTAELIDEEVKKQIAEQYERAKSLLTEHAEGHAQLAQRLIEKEVIFAEDVEEIFGKRPWMSRADELLADEQNRKAIEAVSLGTDKEAGKNEPTAETDEAATASADSEKAENNRPSSADESTSEMENNGMTPSEK